MSVTFALLLLLSGNVLQPQNVGNSHNASHTTPKKITSAFKEQKTAVNTGSTSSANINTNNGNFVHLNIITTYFYVGEQADSSNGFIANSASAWDGSWQSHYGGVDDPTKRNGYFPAGFTPKENPFYIALPYNDLDENGKRKPSANQCPNSSTKSNYSWCKNSWVMVRYGSKIAYAQWQDVGPFEEDDASYVFGTSAPKNKDGARAGLDVSPAVRDYLGLNGLNNCDWAFVSENDVPIGPWKQIITTSKGYSF